MHSGSMARYFTTERDDPEEYERIVEQMHPEQRKEFLDKHIEIQLPEVKEVYEKMDNILITDGGIFNLPEVIDYLNSTSEVTRNVVCVIDNPGQYKEWEAMGLKNTQIIPVDKPKDLIGVAIGEVKQMVPPEDKPKSLFAY